MNPTMSPMVYANLFLAWQNNTEFQFRDDMGIIESQQENDILSRLVDSNFDLSILP